MKHNKFKIGALLIALGYALAVLSIALISRYYYLALGYYIISWIMFIFGLYLSREKIAEFAVKIRQMLRKQR